MSRYTHATQTQPVRGRYEGKDSGSGSQGRSPGVDAQLLWPDGAPYGPTVTLTGMFM